MKTKPQNRNTDFKTEAQDKNQNHKFKYKTESGQHHKCQKLKVPLMLVIQNKHSIPGNRNPKP